MSSYRLAIATSNVRGDKYDVPELQLQDDEGYPVSSIPLTELVEALLPFLHLQVKKPE